MLKYMSICNCYSILSLYAHSVFYRQLLFCLFSVREILFNISKRAESHEIFKLNRSWEGNGSIRNWDSIINLMKRLVPGHLYSKTVSLFFYFW